MAIISATINDLKGQAVDLLSFANRLLHNPKRLDDLHLLDRSVDWCDHRADWDQRFVTAHASNRQTLNNSFAILVEHLWEVHGDEYAATAYQAIEQWLRSQTLIVQGYRPRFTLISLWLVTAIHNWLWWRTHSQRSARAPTAAGGELTSLEAKLVRDVDCCLDVLARNESRLQFGDLVVMHVMAANLRRVVADHLKDLTAAELVRLARIQSANAISRIAATDLPETAFGSENDDERLPGVRVLLGDPGAAGVREYLASNLGQRAIRTAADARRTTHLLAALAPTMPGPQDAERISAQAFVGRVLRGAMQMPDRDDQSDDWEPWCANWENGRSVAHICGRFGNWAEKQVQHRHSDGMTEVEWLWREVARQTLRRWFNARGSAIFAWGCWIEGFLAEGMPPRIVVGRSPVGRTFREMIEDWRLAADREYRLSPLRQRSSRRSRTSSTNSETDVEALKRLRLRLEDRSEFKSVPQEVLLSAAAARAGETGGPGRRVEGSRDWRGTVRVYRCPSDLEEES